MKPYPMGVFVILSYGLLVASAQAEDSQVIDVKPCNLMCGLWRNISGDAQVSSPTPIDNGAVHDEHIPEATEGLGVPKTSDLAATPGTIIAQSAAERTMLRKERARLERETTAKIDAHVLPFKSN